MGVHHSRFVLAVVFAASCSSGSDDASPPTASFAARFELPASGPPDLLEVPFPSDLQRATDGSIALVPGTNDVPRGLNRVLPNEKAARYMADALARAKGFGNYGGALFELTGGAPDSTKLPTGRVGDCTGKGSSAFIVDLDDGRSFECQAMFHDPPAMGDDALARTLMVRTATGVVVPEGHHVAVLLTSAMTTATGVPLTASQTFASIRDGARPSAAAQQYGAAIDTATSKLGVDKKTIVAAAVYTTGRLTDELVTTRDLAAATPVPTLAWSKEALAPVADARFAATKPLPTGFTATLDDLLGVPHKLAAGPRAGEDDPDIDASNPGLAHDAIGAMGVAVFDAPNFMLERGGFGDPDHGVFFHGADGKVAINPAKPTSKVWVTIIVPSAPAKDAAGYPVVVYQHGGGGDRRDALMLANTFAHRGWATVAIELVRHGSRATDADKRGDSTNDIGASGATYKGPDGFTDPTSSSFAAQETDMVGGFYRLAAARDHFRQTAVDHTTLVRILRSSPTLDALTTTGAAPKLDGSRIAYVGGSLGGITGAILSSIEGAHRAYVLNVPPAGFLQDFSFSPGSLELLVGAGALIFGFSPAEIEPANPLFVIGQHVIDAVEPYALARRVIATPAAGEKPRNVLILEAMHDESVANASTEGLARAMGIPVVSPHASLRVPLTEVSGASLHDQPIAGITSALVQVSPAAHYRNIGASKGKRNYALDEPVWGDPTRPAFRKLDKPLEFTQSYLEQQALIVQYIADAFDGKAPTIDWTLAPKD